MHAQILDLAHDEIGHLVWCAILAGMQSGSAPTFERGKGRKGKRELSSIERITSLLLIDAGTA